MRLLGVLLLAFGLASPAWAGDVAVTLADARGQPISNAVVMVRPASGARPRLPGPHRVEQKDMRFEPFVLIVPVGAEVAFPNLDRVRHHVYSFAPTKTFELKLYARGEAPSVRFEKPGVVGIGCNIHDDMSAFIRVVDTHAAKTAAGSATVREVPPGPAEVVIWHPHLKAPRSEIVRRVVVPQSGAVQLTLAAELRPARLRHGGY
jgi:plastocyanin